MKLKLEDKTSQMIGLGIFFILFLDILLILRPQLLLLSQVRSNKNSLVRDLKAARQDIASQAQFKQRLADLKAKVEIVGERISREEEIPLVLEDISKVAKETNLKITQLKPSRENEKLVASAQGGAIYELPILIEARCGYHQLGRFLNNLENGRIFINMVGLELSSSPEESLRHNAKLILQTYILKK